MSFQTSALILTWVAILLLALVASGLIRQVHALSAGGTQRPGSLGLQPGSPAPGFDRLAPDRPEPVVLLFLGAECRTCAEVLDEAGHASRDGVTLRALYAGPVPAAPPDLPVPVQGEQAELFERYDVVATPLAVVIDRAGRVVRSEPIGSRAALHGLLERVRDLSGGGSTSTTAGAEQLGGRP
jgi:hypothetical protein